MHSRWFLTQFYFAPEIQMRLPVCSAYGGRYRCPVLPSAEDGWGLCLMLVGHHQLEAARQDPRVLVLPDHRLDDGPLDARAIAAYKDEGAFDGMSLKALLTMLAKTEPIFSFPEP